MLNSVDMSNTSTYKILACSIYKRGSELVKSLNIYCGKENVYPVFVDYRTSTTCFHIIRENITHTENMINIFSNLKNAGLLTWTNVPIILKLDPTLIKFCNVILDKDNYFLRTNNLENYVIEIVFELGVMDMGLDGLDITSAIKVNS